LSISNSNVSDENMFLSYDAECRMYVRVLKVLNSKVAEEMDIVENHLTGLTGI